MRHARDPESRHLQPQHDVTALVSMKKTVELHRRTILDFVKEGVRTGNARRFRFDAVDYAGRCS